MKEILLDERLLKIPPKGGILGLIKDKKTYYSWHLVGKELRLLSKITAKDYENLMFSYLIGEENLKKKFNRDIKILQPSSFKPPSDLDFVYADKNISLDKVKVLLYTILVCIPNIRTTKFNQRT